jgi:CheY-like chemotaxis protein
MGGRETLEALRAIVPTLPVVMMSGYSQEEAESRFPGEQPTAFIQKPYELAILREVVRRSVANV